MIEWQIELASTLEAVDQFCEGFQLWRADHCPTLDRFSSELLLREALTNSVVHGNAGSAGKRIFCVLRAKPNHLFIAVQDDGAGFDWKEACSRPLDEEVSHGRGIEILKRYANTLRFNPKGNAVMLIKRFGQVHTS